MQVQEFLDSLSSFENLSTVGSTLLDTPIPMISKGKGERGKVLLIGAVHAREYVTAPLLTSLIEDYNGEYPVDCIPLLNVDGVRLAVEGLNALPLKLRDRATLLRLNGGSTDFSLWKANVRGVDLNVNCDADWGNGKGNVNYPAPEGYVGPCPFSENESYAVKKLIDSSNYALVVCYHSKGEEVYYGFKHNLKYKNEALRVARKLGYKLKTTPHSTGGIKDYFTYKTGYLGLTIEVGNDKLAHPITLDHLEELKIKHKGIINLFTDIAKRIWTN